MAPSDGRKKMTRGEHLESFRTDEMARALISASSSIIVGLDTTSNVVLFNKGAECITGFKAKEAIGRNWIDTFIPKDFRSSLHKGFRRVLSRKSEMSVFENPILTKSGQVRTIRWKNAVLTEKGRVVMTFSIGEDVTDIRAKQKELEDSELKYRTIFETSAEGIVIADKTDHKILYANPSICRLLGYGPDAIVGSDIPVIFPKSALKKILSEFDELSLGRKSLARNILLRRKDGTTFPSDLHSSSIRIGGRDCIVGFFTDVTFRNDSENEIRDLNRIIGMVRDCNQALVRADNEIALVRDICRIVVEKGGYRLVWVGYPDKSNEKRVAPVANYGFEKGYLKKLRITYADTPLGRGPTGMAIRTGRPSICRNIHSDPRFAPWRADALKRGYSSSISLPLISKGEVLGALNIYSEKEDAFQDTELRLLKELCYDLAFGLSSLRAKGSLVESEKTLSAIFNNASDIVVFVDASGTIAKINPSVGRMWGYRPSDIIGKRFSELTDLLPPRSMALMRENFRKRLSGVDVKSYLIEVRTREGKPVIAEVRGSKIGGREGVAGAVVTLSDITERISSEKRLLASYQVASFLSAGGPLRFTWPAILRTICSNLGWVWGEIWVADAGKSKLLFAESWHKPSKRYRLFEKVTPNMRFRCGSGLPGRVWADGKPVWVPNLADERIFLRASAAKAAGFKSACAIPITIWDETVGAMLFFADEVRSPDPELLQALNLLGYQVGQFIKRKSVETALRDSEVRFRGVFERSPVGILLTAPDFHFIRANPSACKIFGFTESELQSRTFRDITHPEQIERDIGQMALLRAGQIPFYRTEKRYIRKDGKVIWGLVNVSAIRDPDGRLQYYLAVVEDISEQKLSENLLRSQKEQLEDLSKIKEVFMADMAHELKTPLSVILLNLEMIRTMDPERQKDSMAESHELIWRNTNRMVQTIEQIMKLSSIDSVDIARRRFSLRSMIWEVIGDYLPLARTKGLRLDMEGKGILLRGDQHLLSMALSNLISNSIKFTDQGYVHVCWEERDNHIQIKVTDSGIGIRKENQGKVFEKFFKENHDAPGSGIGLAISYMVISKMGGRIDFNSMKGKGSTFRIIIPKGSRT